MALLTKTKIAEKLERALFSGRKWCGVQLGAGLGETVVFAAGFLGQQDPERVYCERRAERKTQQRQESEEEAKHSSPRLALEKPPREEEMEEAEEA